MAIPQEAITAAFADLLPTLKQPPTDDDVKAAFADLQPAPPAPPRDTTFGEKAAGTALGLASGSMVATKGVVDLIDAILPKPLEPFITDKPINILQTGIDAAQNLKPEAFKAKQGQSFLNRAEDGSIKGLQLPSIEHASNFIAETAPLIPFFLAGGYGTSKVLQSAAPRASKLAADALGFGTTNAALQAPSQAEDTKRQALAAGDSPEIAQRKGNVAGAYTALLMFGTGTAGGGLAAKLGAESGSMVTALAKGFIAEGPFEGLEEGMQQIISDLAVGKDPDLTSALDQTLTATFFGGAPGSSIAGIEHAGNRSSLLPKQVQDAAALNAENKTRLEAAQEATRQPPAPVEAVPEIVSPVVAPEIQPVEPVAPPQEPALATPEVVPPVPLPDSVAETLPVTAYDEAAPPPEPVHRYFEKGKNFQAIELADGRFKVRSKPNSKTPWSSVDWEIRDTLDTRDLTPVEKPSGIVKIKGDPPYKINEPFVEPKSLRGPPDLLEELAAGPKLNRKAFMSEFGLDLPGTHVRPNGFDGVFTDDGGLTPDGLLEYMQQSGEYINQAPEGRPNEATADDAFQLLDKALFGERVVANSRTEEETIFQYALQQADEEARLESEGSLDENESAFMAGFESDPGISDEEIVAFADQRYEKEVANVIEGTTSENVSQGPGVSPAAVSQSAAKPAPIVEPQTSATAKAAPGQPGTVEQGDGGFVTSLKKDVIEQERIARGEDPLISEARQSHPDTMAKADAVIAQNPNRADEIIKDLTERTGTNISTEDGGVLLHEKVRVMNERKLQSDRASDESLTADQRLTAQEKWNELETRINLIEQAARSAGTEAGRRLEFQKTLIAHDFSLAAMESQARAIRGRALTGEEAATIAAQAKEIADLEKLYAESQQALADAIAAAGSKATYEALAQRVGKNLKKKSKPEWLNDLNKKADESRAFLKQNIGRTNAGLDPAMMFHVVRIGASHIGNGVNVLADWIAAMKADLGAKIFGQIEEEAQWIFHDSNDYLKANAVASGIRTIEDIIADVKADVMAGDQLSHRAVYELARAHILLDVHGEDAVMAAVHKDLAPIIEGLTERDVRRAFSEYGKAKFPSKAADRKELAELRELVRRQESIDRLRAGLPALKTGLQRNKATKKIRDKERILNVLRRQYEANHPGTSEERLTSINESRETRIRNQIADLEKQERTGEKPVKAESLAPTESVKQLAKVLDALKEKLRQIELEKNPPPSAEEKYNSIRGRQIQRQLKEVEARLATKDYVKHPRKTPPQLTKENEKLSFDLAQAKMQFLHEQMIWEMEHASFGRKAGDNLLHLISLQRSIMTSYDDSGVLRQGGAAFFAHPIIGARNVKKSFRAVREIGAHAIEEEIKARKNYAFALKSKLELMALNSIDPKKMEELYRSKWQKWIPGVPASGRLFVSFLNLMRMDLFDHAINHYSARGEITLDRGKDLANFVNVVTGRGVIGTREHNLSGQILTAIAFAPKWAASRFNLLAGQPFYRGDKITRKYIAFEYAKMISGFLFVHTMLALMFGDDDDSRETTFNPLSSDFGKVRVGNTRLDATAGMGTTITFVARVLSGWKQTQSGDYAPLRDNFRLPLDGADPNAKVRYGQKDAAGLIGDFGRRKASPPVGALLSIASGKDAVGFPITPAEAVASMFIPLSLNDYVDAMKAHGYTEATAMQVLATFGVGMQTYAERETDKMKPRIPRLRVRTERNPRQR